jgi:signal transduction histidine kinase
MKLQIDELIAEIRRLSAYLRPVALDNFGLVTSLKLLARDVERTSKFSVSFEASVQAEKRFDGRLEIMLYRIAQEALTNVSKHAEATSASLSFVRENGSLRLEISDNGVGFSQAGRRNEGPEDGRFGLLSMRERAELMGGSFEIRSVLNGGTTVRVRLPLSEDSL